MALLSGQRRSRRPADTKRSEVSDIWLRSRQMAKRSGASRANALRCSAECSHLDAEGPIDMTVYTHRNVRINGHTRKFLIEEYKKPLLSKI